MFRFVLFFTVLTLFFSQPTAAQVLAGIDSQLVPGNGTPAQTVNIFTFPPVFGQLDNEAYDSLDLNGDGKYDLLFGAETCNTFDCNGGWTTMRALHPNVAFLTDSIDAIRRLATGDTIDGGQSWDALPEPDIISRVYGLGGYIQLGNWFPQPEGYAGVRLTVGTDTLYGWLKIKATVASGNGAATLKVLQWAIEHDPTQAPYAALTATPGKDVYCAGDSVRLEAHTLGADHRSWYLWDGTTDTAAAVTRALPAHDVTITLAAGNAFGTTTVTRSLHLSGLMLIAPDVVLNCTQPTGTLSAATNVPAEIRWVVNGDTLPDPLPPNVFGFGPFVVIAQDVYGCVAADTVLIIQDNDPPFVTLEYDADQQMLIAHTGTPGTTLVWTSSVLPQPLYGDSIAVTQSGTYFLTAIGPNGCMVNQSIEVVISATDEAPAGTIRVQPNPATDILQIENRSDKDLYFRVWDSTGQLRLADKKITAGSNTSLEISALTSGLHLLAGYDIQGKPVILKPFIKL